MAEVKAKPKQFFDRDPYPKIEEDVIAAGVGVDVSYQNGTEEMSEVKKIQIDAPPLCQVKISRWDDNTDQVVQDTMRIADLPVEDGHAVIKFREVERDKPLTIRKNQKIIVTITNTYAFQVAYFCKIFKNALRFYTPPAEVEMAQASR